jgi:hypothetical protein
MLMSPPPPPGGGTTPPPGGLVVVGLLTGQLMATESLPFLMSKENWYVFPAITLGPEAFEIDS